MPTTSVRALLSTLEHLGIDSVPSFRSFAAADIPIRGVSHPSTQGEDSLTWLKRWEQWNGCGFAIGPLPADTVAHPLVEIQGIAICVEDPRTAFALLARKTFSPSSARITGPNVSVHHTAVIGEEGFGYVEHAGEYIRFPHYGGVVLGANVEIDEYAVIKRGVLNDTHVGAGTKIGHHASIGHGAFIGEGCLIYPHAAICGSIVVGNGASIGVGAVVTRNVPDGATWVGVPASRFRRRLAPGQAIARR